MKGGKKMDTQDKADEMKKKTATEADMKAKDAKVAEAKDAK